VNEFHAAIAAATISLVVMATASCTSKTVRVGVVFDNDWQIGEETLTPQEQSIAKRTALRTLQHAFTGFGLSVSEGRGADRLIVVDKGYAAGLVPSGRPAPVGETYPFAFVSKVHFDETVHTLLAVVGCETVAACSRKTRAEIVEGVGRGIGSTAAHELGHQVGFRFSVDSDCDECYDSHTSKTYQHFFGTKHWSDRALTIMRRVLASDVDPPGHARSANDSAALIPL
jgi:hypothetical protein